MVRTSHVGNAEDSSASGVYHASLVGEQRNGARHRTGGSSSTIGQVASWVRARLIGCLLGRVSVAGERSGRGSRALDRGRTY
jgi:hypothetical protein